MNIGPLVLHLQSVLDLAKLSLIHAVCNHLYVTSKQPASVRMAAKFRASVEGVRRAGLGGDLCRLPEAVCVECIETRWLLARLALVDVLQAELVLPAQLRVLLGTESGRGQMHLACRPAAH